MKKTFDCIAMKDAIQERLLKELAGCSPTQQRAMIQNTLERSNSLIGVLWRTLERRETTRTGCVAEASEAYGVETGRKPGAATTEQH